MRYLTYLLPLMLFVTACGGGSDKANSEKQASNDANDAQMSQEANDVRTIHLIGVDQMKYVVKDDSQEGVTTGKEIGNNGMLNVKSIDAEPGEKIRIELKAKSKLPASAMAHNFILLALETDVEAFDSAASSATDNDYIPEDKADQIIAHTELASGGDTVEITFTVPEEAGEYPYICSFPGHYLAGMEGTLNVK